MNNTLVKQDNLLANRTTDLLKEMARQLVSKTGEDAAEVSEALHSVMLKLEDRLSENSYIEFCVSLEAYIK
jgi:hypothetical protein